MSNQQLMLWKGVHILQMILLLPALLRQQSKSLIVDMKMALGGVNRYAIETNSIIFQTKLTIFEKLLVNNL